MRFSDFPFLRYVPFLFFGVTIGSSTEFPFPILIVLLVLIGITYSIIVVFYIKKFDGFYRSILAYLMLFLFGIILSSFPENEDQGTSWQDSEGYLAEVTLYDHEKPNSFENLLEIKSVNKNGAWEKSDGKVLIYHQLDYSLEPGMILWVRGFPDKIDPPSNPNEFDYSKFLKGKGIEYRQFVGSKVAVLGKNKNSERTYFLEHLRRNLSNLLQEKIPDPKSYQVAQALLLGQKQYLDQDIKKAYSNSGVMHILAVSGLHVGIVYALLMFLVKPFGLKKMSKKSYLTLVILLIWAYALLTGFSPSVVRAATMFSLVTLGQMRERKPSIFNVLAFSALVMVTINPKVIFEVGFQLSYLAVIGIVLIQPLIIRFWLPPNKRLEYVWQIIAVSLAAQLATLPLTIYYFHSFPTYFLLGNLFIIPLAFLIMQVGVPLLLFGWVPFLGDFLGIIVSKLIWIQNLLIDQIQLLPNSNLERLTISPVSMIVIWVFLLIWAAWDQSKKRKLVWIAMCLTFIWSGFRIVQLFDSYQHEIIIYQTENGILLDHSYLGKMRSWNIGVPAQDITYKIDPFRIQKGWSKTPESLLSSNEPDSVYYFPLEKIEIDPSKKLVVFHGEGPKSIRTWNYGEWEKNSESLRIPYSESAIQILF